MKKYLIIGNGIAGTTAAEEIRKHDPQGEITLITREPLPLYSRIRLPDYLCGKIDLKDLVIKHWEWHEKNNIKLITDIEIISIDYNSKTAHAKNGKTFNFDSLLLASGSSPFIPPVKGIDSSGVFTLRTVDDADKIIKKAASNRTSNIKKEFVIIGGGVLGLEAAGALINSGVKVTIIEFFDRLLPRQLDYNGAELLQKMLENMGFVFKLGETVEEIIGKESEQAGKLASLIKGLKLKPVVQGVKLKSGSIIKADAVLFSAGVRPDLSLAFNKQASPDLPQGEDTLNDSDTPNDINNSNNIDTNLLVDKGIVVNERMETSLPSVYAAGDTAEYQGVNFCIWTEAMAQGRAAGINMAGGEAVYKNIIPSHILKVAGISVASAGYIDIDGKMESEIISNESVYKKIVKDNNGKTAGCIMVGDTADFNKILHQIKGE